MNEELIKQIALEEGITALQVKNTLKLLEEGKNKANQTVEDVKKEALNQYEQFKEDIKSNVKDTVNKKIDESFDKI